METLIIVFIILYAVFSRLGRMAKHTPPPPGPRETDFPFPDDAPDYDLEDDAPLSGPWNRDGGKPPARRTEEPQTFEPVLMEPEPQRAGNRRHAPEPVEFRQPVEQPVPLHAVRQQLEPGQEDCPQGQPAMRQEREPRKKRRRKNPLAAALKGKPEVIGSIVVGEVIGTRGGYRGRRK